MTHAIRVQNLNKTFGTRQVLHNLELDVPPGAMVALIGASGSGKSTLLRHLAGLAIGDRQAGGDIQMLGRQMQKDGMLNSNVRRLRSDIGYIFQQFNLVGRLSVVKNVLLGSLGRMSRVRGALGLFNKEEINNALQALERVGLLEYAYRRASTLSGGQQQRVAIARALCQKAEIILADEPIASLDPESARKVMETLADINKRDGKTIIVTLHQVDYAVKYCRHAVALKSGKKFFDGPIAGLSNGFLSELYGSEIGTALLFGEQEAPQPTPARDPARLVLAAA
ncbi:phosphonate ABC transporter ATP-binding protein [Advenella sp. S44]|uniref:phosphonate ABC transporter ATP-binding protein n=1 Tax=Advenella sp. S44 TaxID=1982755 RepID=UPI000C2AFE75|nr:phosphonate ABC transporter ATP-binding protein [Advenella sp. S44]PJX25438.1 phosphonate ABC transporter ATP-binding protein [Advenella sp. S44]